MSSDLKEKLREITGEYDTEAVIETLRDIVEEDLSAYVEACTAQYKRDEVVACLEACINHLQDASTAYYASLK